MTEKTVLIAGGGMVGATLALALARLAQLPTTVVEGFAIPPASTPPRHRESFDARVTALSWGSRLILERLGLWTALAAHAAPISSVHVSQRGQAGVTRMGAAEQGWPALGYVVENAWLGQVLMAALEREALVSLQAPATVTALRPGTGAMGVEIADAAPREAALVVVADGARSRLRQGLGIAVDRHDYDSVAIIANVGLARAHGGVAFERFLDDGPMALLPLPDSDGQARAGLVWTLPTARAEALLAASDDAFLASLQRGFGQRLGPLLRVGQRSHYPLALFSAREQVRSRVVVMGNAAHALHPVAGQGFNLALRDVLALAETLRGERDPGALAVLQRYADRQQADQQRTIRFSDHLPGLFALGGRRLAPLRGLGLLGLDLCPPLRRRFTARAAGMAPGSAGALA